MKTLIITALLVFSAANLSTAETVLVEAESFDNPGGWVVDQQSMDQTSQYAQPWRARCQ